MPLGANYHLLQSGVECSSSDESLGEMSNVQACANACMARAGCRFFLYGSNGASGCYYENTGSASCSEGSQRWVTANYDFYEYTTRSGTYAMPMVVVARTTPAHRYNFDTFAGTLLPTTMAILPVPEKRISGAHTGGACACLSGCTQHTPVITSASVQVRMRLMTPGPRLQAQVDHRMRPATTRVQLTRQRCRHRPGQRSAPVSVQ